MINEDKPIWTATAISIGIMVAWGFIALHRGPGKSAGLGSSFGQPTHSWLRWRWIPVAVLYLFGGLCLFVALWGWFWFDAERCIMISEIRGIDGWRLQLWDLFCNWPANTIKGCLAIYAGWSIWWTNWKATQRAVVVLVILLAFAAIANYLTEHRLFLF